MDVDGYLARIGLDERPLADPEGLERIHRAHGRSIPFENLAVVGDPFADGSGPGVTLTEDHLYRKLVERGRGGHCYEHNALARWALDALGFDVTRVGARVVNDGEPVHPPANHMAVVVALDRRYLVDVGQAAPYVRRPVPLDGTPRTDEVGRAWRVVASDRPDETHRAQYRSPEADEWTGAYAFAAVDRPLSYFAAANDYFELAPESGINDDPWLALATADGSVTLSGTTLIETTADGDRERELDGETEWWSVVEERFGIRRETVGGTD
jgi:N-hydroxyarylamine O-acetyltransferase